MSLYSNIIEQILQEVDPDIRDLMIATDGKYKGYEMLDANAALTILTWQAMRDRKNDNVTIEGKPTTTEE